jgi:hypothetical protein
VGRLCCILAGMVLVAIAPAEATSTVPDLVRGSGINEGWFEFDVHAAANGAPAQGRLHVEEFGATNYDIDRRVVCMATSGDGAVIAAARPETDTTMRVVFLSVRDLNGTGLGPDRAAPAFSVVSASQPLDGLCENALFLLGHTEPLDAGGVTVRDR